MRPAFLAPLAVAVAYCFGFLVYAGIQAKELPSHSIQWLIFWLAAFAFPAFLLTRLIRGRIATDGAVAVVGSFLLLLSVWLGQDGYIRGDPTSRAFILPLMCVPFWVALLVPFLLAKSVDTAGSEQPAPPR